MKYWSKSQYQEREETRDGWSHHPCKCSEIVDTLDLAGFSSGHGGSAVLIVGLDDLVGLFQPWGFSACLNCILWLECLNDFQNTFRLHHNSVWSCPHLDRMCCSWHVHIHNSKVFDTFNLVKRYCFVLFQNNWCLSKSCFSLQRKQKQ